MENQVSPNIQNSSSVEQIPTTPQVLQTQSKVNFLPIVFAILISGILFGAGGYYLGKQTPTSSLYTNNGQTKTLPTTEPQVTTPTVTPNPIETVNIPGWKNYSISLINLAFQYPPNLVVATDINNSTALAADKEYWVAVDGSDVLYLDTFLYKSSKTPTDWWNTEGKGKFEKLANEIEQAMSPTPSIHLTYSTQPVTFAGKQALEVTIASDYGSPNTPTQRFLTIFQQSGYVVMTSYHDQGTTASSIDVSKQILSTFKFTN